MPATRAGGSDALRQSGPCGSTMQRVQWGQRSSLADSGAKAAGVGRPPATPWHGKQACQDAPPVLPGTPRAHPVEVMSLTLPEPRWGTIDAYQQHARRNDLLRLRQEMSQTQHTLNNFLASQVHAKKQEREEQKAEDIEVREFQRLDMLRERAEEAAKKDHKRQEILALEREHHEILQARLAQKREAKLREKEEHQALVQMAVAEAQDAKRKEAARTALLRSQLAQARDECTALVRRRKEEEREQERRQKQAAAMHDAAAAKAYAEREAVKQLVNERRAENYLEASARQKAQRQQEKEAAAKSMKEMEAREQAQLRREQADRQAAERLYTKTQAGVLEQIQQKQAAAHATMVQRQQEIKQFDEDVRDFKASEHRKAFAERQRLHDYQQQLQRQVDEKAAKSRVPDAMSEAEAKMNRKLLEAIHMRMPLSAR
mmetsp:Transcript_70601/g.169157  ORF Transcript_70601/g.169157 Transcript_70601/m.169157 type:complete len:431 (-) Transcript_70601:116-1408(-)